MWKDKIFAYFKVFLQNMQGGTEEDHGNFSKDGRV